MYRAATIAIKCAWCRQVKVGRHYKHLGLTVLLHEIDLPGKSGKSVHYEVSHGICELCKAQVLGRSLAA